MSHDPVKIEARKDDRATRYQEHRDRELRAHLCLVACGDLTLEDLKDSSKTRAKIKKLFNR